MTSAPLPETTAVLSLVGHASLAFELLHREPLYVHALRALVAATDGEPLVVVRRPDVDRVVADVTRVGIAARVVTADGWWPAACEASTTVLLVHDALCPLASADFLASFARRGGDASVVACRPVTDTVKTAVDGAIQGTIDREALAAVTSPVRVSGAVLAAARAAGDEPPVADFAALVRWLRERGEVELVTAPAIARRVDDASAVHVLECVDELSRQVVSGGGAARTP